MTQQVRLARQIITAEGQASPPELAHTVAQIFRRQFEGHVREGRGLSVLDVGCGLGSQMKIIADSLPSLFSRIEGIDWSPATVAKHHADAASIYAQVKLCNSKSLPYEGGSFDVALSMENLEHLYGHDSIDAIREMARVAKTVIITTPLPRTCIHLDWLRGELAEAVLDVVPLSRHDYVCLESTVHKSTIFPRSMLEAGFVAFKSKAGFTSEHGMYFANSQDIRFDAIRVLGIDEHQLDEYLPCASAESLGDYKQRYLALLAKSIKLRDEIARHPANIEV
jgi:2-polyprenyl-3-methyl-5-hydroxy-6-metoxy-1,4-benzoquinol methylase